MFLPTREPLLLSEAGLLGFHASLNSPIVDIDDLPVGPSRAAIVLHAEEYGTLALSLGLQSIQSGQVVLYRYQGRLDETASPSRCMNEAITFAERMGFIFDDDLVAAGGSKGRSRALQAWQELLGEAPLEDEDAAEASAPELTFSELEPLDAGGQPGLLESELDDDLDLLLEVDDGFEEQVAQAARGFDAKLSPVLIEDELAPGVVAVPAGPDAPTAAMPDEKLEGEAVWFEEEEEEAAGDEGQPDGPAPPPAVAYTGGSDVDELLELSDPDEGPDLLGDSWEDAGALPVQAQTLELGADRLAETALATTPVPAASMDAADGGSNAVAAGEGASLSGAVSLTKFRTAVDERDRVGPDTAGAGASSPSELGRIPIVRLRRRADGASDPPRPSVLSRLLGSF